MQQGLGNMRLDIGAHSIALAALFRDSEMKRALVAPRLFGCAYNRKGFGASYCCGGE